MPAAVEKSLAMSAPIISQYEALRMAGLGEAVLPESRSGLTLFLRRGMWSWAKEMIAAKTCDQSSCSRSSNTQQSMIQSEGLVQALASIVLTQFRRQR
ncbi:MAG: hypothetical protein DRQ56_07800 [Gammaproteobacteria bacterium]|nr:MAG: hypothetical protein DRQ56_07800 [Gammaproteobacteria bacterium]